MLASLRVREQEYWPHHSHAIDSLGAERVDHVITTTTCDSQRAGLEIVRKLSTAIGALENGPCILPMQHSRAGPDGKDLKQPQVYESIRVCFLSCWPLQQWWRADHGGAGEEG